jgi:hypothetical protein
VGAKELVDVVERVVEVEEVVELVVTTGTLQLKQPISEPDWDFEGSDWNISSASDPLSNIQLTKGGRSAVSKAKELQPKVWKQVLAQSSKVATEIAPFGSTNSIAKLMPGTLTNVPSSSQVRPTGVGATRVQVGAGAGELVDVVLKVGFEVTSAGRTKERAARSRDLLNAIFIIWY